MPPSLAPSRAQPTRSSYAFDVAARRPTGSRCSPGNVPPTHHASGCACSLGCPLVEATNTNTKKNVVAAQRAIAASLLQLPLTGERNRPSCTRSSRTCAGSSNIAGWQREGEPAQQQNTKKAATVSSVEECSNSHAACRSWTDGMRCRRRSCSSRLSAKRCWT